MYQVRDWLAVESTAYELLRELQQNPGQFRNLYEYVYYWPEYGGEVEPSIEKAVVGQLMVLCANLPFEVEREHHNVRLVELRDEVLRRT